MPFRIRILPAAVLLLGAVLWLTTPGAARSQVSDQPDTPFKLATFEAAGDDPHRHGGPDGAGDHG